MGWSGAVLDRPAGMLQGLCFEFFLYLLQSLFPFFAVLVSCVSRAAGFNSRLVFTSRWTRLYDGLTLHLLTFWMHALLRQPACNCSLFSARDARVAVIGPGNGPGGSGGEGGLTSGETGTIQGRAGLGFRALCSSSRGGEGCAGWRLGWEGSRGMTFLGLEEGRPGWVGGVGATEGGGGRGAARRS
eukprot:19811-Chlamydomonas_euryale.AAC.1